MTGTSTFMNVSMNVQQRVHERSWAFMKAHDTAMGAIGLPCAVSYTHLRAHETREELVCRLLLEKKKLS